MGLCCGKKTPDEPESRSVSEEMDGDPTQSPMSALSPRGWMQPEGEPQVPRPQNVLRDADEDLARRHDLVSMRVVVHQFVALRSDCVMWLASGGGASDGEHSPRAWLSPLPWLYDPGAVLDRMVPLLSKPHEAAMLRSLGRQVTLLVEAYDEDDDGALNRAEALGLIYDIVTEELVRRREWLPVYRNWAEKAIADGRMKRLVPDGAACELRTSSKAASIDAMLVALWRSDTKLCGRIFDWMAVGDELDVLDVDQCLIGSRAGDFYREVLRVLSEEVVEAGLSSRAVPCRPVALAAEVKRQGLWGDLKAARRSQRITKFPMLRYVDRQTVDLVRQSDKDALHRVTHVFAEGYLSLLCYSLQKLTDWADGRPTDWGRTFEGSPDGLLATLRLELLAQQHRPHHGLAQLLQVELNAHGDLLEDMSRLLFSAHQTGGGEGIDLLLTEQQFKELVALFVSALGAAEGVTSVYDAHTELLGAMTALVELVRKGSQDPSQRNLPKAAVILRDDPLVQRFVAVNRRSNLSKRLEEADPATYRRRWRLHRAGIVKAWVAASRQDLANRDTSAQAPAKAKYFWGLSDLQRALFGPQLPFVLLRSAFLCLGEQAAGASGVGRTDSTAHAARSSSHRRRSSDVSGLIPTEIFPRAECDAADPLYDRPTSPADPRAPLQTAAASRTPPEREPIFVPDAAAALPVPTHRDPAAAAPSTEEGGCPALAQSPATPLPAATADFDQSPASVVTAPASWIREDEASVARTGSGAMLPAPPPTPLPAPGTGAAQGSAAAAAAWQEDAQAGVCTSPFAVPRTGSGCLLPAPPPTPIGVVSDPGSELVGV